MNTLFDWWFATSLRIRQFCWAVWLLMLVTLIFLSSTHHEERDALIRLRASNHQQWTALYRLVDTTPIIEEKTLPFSPLDFQLPGAQLLYWHPSAQGGELALKTFWEAVPSAFTRLAERNVSVSRFLLSVEGGDLLFTLQLEMPHEG
ncbi:TPA: DNA utilization protein HofO [Escherichia coli]|uniref:DNA utilization protein HofO n=1 Tax=Escherichia TaxID=561 RepID=UPI0002BC618D|nr:MULTISPECIES: DNA utilization protein HofO [Escherichia]EFE0634736.1 DNA utilization protein HofO [Escherichia coli]EFN7663503.1 DNA utilization protein HofO [Escherichia coli]EOU46269.1 pilus assembly protein HofO [Escherichia sp. KTE114]KZO61257.1 DNA utilization protein HofO [Escherichia coli]MBY7513475.1 DNA utilization protein HofO [Escherichia ruysiae]